MKNTEIISLPNPKLRQKSIKVTEINDRVHSIIKEMEAAVLKWEESRPHEISAAISAVQIGYMDKIVVVRSDFDDKSATDFTALINPKIIKYEGNIDTDYEGCLSVPDVYGLVPRNTKIRIKALDIDGNEVRFKANGFLARLLQHEIDHTNGVVFIDHIKDVTDAFYKLDEKGELIPLNYEKYIRNNSILW